MFSIVVPIHFTLVFVPTVKGAATEVRPQQTVRAFRPWISSGTIAVIEKRMTPGGFFWVDDEKALRMQIKLLVTADMWAWFDEMLAEGDWSQIRKVHKR